MAKTVTDYPITLDFRDTFMPYYGPGGSIYIYHHGIDYGAPCGTPLVVGNTLLGYSGKTGTTTDCHCHIDKSRTYPSTYSGYVDPADWPTITGIIHFTGSAGSAGNIVVIRADNGYFYRFLHLSSINVSVGQRINQQGGTNMDYKALYEGCDAELKAERITYEARIRDLERQLQGVKDSLEGERKGYEALLKAYQDLMAATGINKTSVLKYIEENLK